MHVLALIKAVLHAPALFFLSWKLCLPPDSFWINHRTPRERVLTSIDSSSVADPNVIVRFVWKSYARSGSPFALMISEINTFSKVSFLKLSISQSLCVFVFFAPNFMLTVVSKTTTGISSFRKVFTLFLMIFPVYGVRLKFGRLTTVIIT